MVGEAGGAVLLDGSRACHVKGRDVLREVSVRALERDLDRHRSEHLRALDRGVIGGRQTNQGGSGVLVLRVEVTLEVELRGGRVPGCTVGELHTLAQVERPNRRRLVDLPRAGEVRNDGGDAGRAVEVVAGDDVVDMVPDEGNA